MSRLFAVAAALILAGCAGTTLKDPVGPDKVVYHLNSGLEQAKIGRAHV